MEEPLHVCPVAVSVKEIGPAPLTEYVQENVWDPPAGIVTGEDGAGPETRASPAEFPYGDAETLTASCPPLFVTVSVTVIPSPTTAETGPLEAATRTAAGVTVRVFDTASPVVRLAPDRASTAVTVAEKYRGPEPAVE